MKPIVYYIDAATPMKWVPWLKKGIERLEAGVRGRRIQERHHRQGSANAEEDPDWSPEDVRNSVIRWLPSTIENASGPHIADPRTGEILNADIQFYHNVMNLARDWYFVQVGPLDPRAAKLPLPDDLMGRLLEYVTAHEVGHTLGFQHNMKASSMYPAEKIRDQGVGPRRWATRRRSWTTRASTTSRSRRTAFAAEDLIPRSAPMTSGPPSGATRPIPGAKTPDDEKPTLNRWAHEQDRHRGCRFSTAASAGADPGELTEAVGDADAIKSTALGVKNLQRVAKMLMSGNRDEAGRDVRRSGGALRPLARTVDARNEPRRRHRRRLQQSGESTSGRKDRSSIRCPGRSRRARNILERERVHYAVLDGRPGDSAAHRSRWAPSSAFATRRTRC